ncbi:MAG TPA: alpha/beta hydrolase [Polyangiaceae bacterium LLY-WYZ-15_(1-7)]|nr:alpha/beta hydrolase [Myxococcales bacterium]MAT25002.1 alpha/beta hydrolase [Sandaracinus sp.]HJK93878.1 alpha/beta hydrolase [Polyangiaceae bacterium LLY-WYZ-15_(1-7)]MBJ69883.1 alpha/beta hydrolase [Sandaracinus sp.]HJL03363.1 alpha/beta hydrolase [Polyangiaceae bacterium LLY-WYZ-15_(1-7)]
MKAPQVEERRCTSADGTEIAYHVVGEGPPVLLCNGLGGSWMAWTHQIRYFEDRYRFISWDYRGLYRSGPPSTPDALRIVDHTMDALAVLEAEGVERAAFVGWSMGVQVALELFARHPERVANLVLVNGVSGQPWSTVLNLGVMGDVLPPVIRGLGSFPRLAEALTRRVVGMPETVQWAKRMGLAARTLDEDIFQQLAGSFGELDMGVYLRILELLGEHDATRFLDDVDVPTLIIAGDRDLFTPRAAAERMARRIAGAELLVVPGGTHYVAVEYPELVNLRIEKFFRERGWGEASP